MMEMNRVYVRYRKANGPTMRSCSEPATPENVAKCREFADRIVKKDDVVSADVVIVKMSEEVTYSAKRV